MEELDLLKKAWQKDQHQEHQFSEKDIYSMLHKKSSSIVKWILIISILEVCLWTGISIIYNTDEYFKKMHAEELMGYFKILTYFNYVVILGFIYLFYKNYVKITATSSTKQLMKDILKTRKTVQYYVWYNLGMLVVSMILGFIMAFSYNPDLDKLKYKIAHDSGNWTLICTIGFLAAAIVVFVGLFWLFYRLLYGILLKKLHSNYKELEKIDL